MKHLFYLLLILCSGSVLVLSGCRNKTENADIEATDSLVTDTLSETLDSLSPIIGGHFATEIFSDFFDEFVHNKNVQLHRIKFPLQWTAQQETRLIEKKDWQYDALYSNNDYYTLIYDAKSFEQEQEIDTVSKVVTYQVFNLREGNVRNYRFEILEARWVLTSVDERSWKETDNADFLDFYQSFVSNNRYQFAHIANPFFFTSYDFDTDEELSGTLDAIQWPEFRPELSKEWLTNIVYGNARLQGNQRIIRMIAPGDGGMNVVLRFKNKGGKWLLYEQNNQ